MTDKIEDTMHDDELEVLQALDEGPPQVLDLVISLPDKDTPGYLGRMRRLVYFQSLELSTISVEMVDELVEFLLDSIVEPERDVARERLLNDVSAAQLREIMEAISGGTPAVPPA